MNSTRLVDYFQEKQKITKEQADEIRVALSTGAGSEEKLLLDKQLVGLEDVARAKSEMFNIPFVDLKEIAVEDSLFSAISLDKLKKYNAVPYERAGHVIKVAMSDPFDVQAIQAMERQLVPKYGNRLLVHVTTQDSISFVLDSHIGGLISSEVSEALEEYEGPITQLDETAGDTLDSTDLQNAPVARIVSSILQYAIKSAASDIHIEPQETSLRVRFRIHGVMIEKLMLPKNLKASVVARVKILSNLKIDEKRVPQDGRFQVKTSSSKFDIRVSIIPTIYGEKVVMRLLDGTAGVAPLESSGLRGSAYDIFVEGLGLTNGIILVTGPTGSGKTRTLAGALDKVNDPKVNIITLEDPVEIRIPGVTQIQINSEVGLTFATGLRSVLRQDPDVVMVGEIRDQETAALAVQASLTGHLVLATLHTNSAAASIPRLLDMGVEGYLLASTLKITAAQRLPRRICRHCIESYPAAPEVLENVKHALTSINGFDIVSYLKTLCDSVNKPNAPEHLKDVKCPEIQADGSETVYLYRGKGCARCGGTGYKGRIGIFEVMKVDEAIGRKMMESVGAQELERMGIANGMVTMIQDGYLKALEGITTIEDVLRVSKD